MTTQNKPMQVNLGGQSVGTPDKPVVKVADELDDAQLEHVAGGVSMIRAKEIAFGVVQLPAGVGAFHLGAWSL